MKSDPLIISNVVGCALGSEGRAVGPLMGVYWVFYRSNRVLLLFHHKVVNNKLRLIVFLNKAFCSLLTVTLATCSVNSVGDRINGHHDGGVPIYLSIGLLTLFSLVVRLVGTERTHPSMELFLI